MVKSSITTERLNKYEDTNNSSVAVRIRDGTDKWIYILGIYRQWKLIGDYNAFDTAGIKKQVDRLESQVYLINKMCSENSNCVIGGVINLDQYKDNNNSNRPEMKALKPIWEKCVLDNNLQQINFKNTWHMPGCKSSLLDLFYVSKPELAENISNDTNITSEHDRVIFNHHTKEVRSNPQFEVVRSYTNVTYDNLIGLLDENKNTKIQEMFNSQDPNLICDTYLAEMNKASKQLVRIKRVQKCKYQTKFWTKRLEAQRFEINYRTKLYRDNVTHEKFRELRKLKNRHSRDMRKAQKEFYTRKYNTHLGKWKCLKEEEDNTTKGLMKAEVDGKLENSPKILADKFSESVIDKVQTIRDELPKNNLTAETVFKELVPKVEEDLKLRLVTIKEVYNIISKSKPK